MVTAVVTIATFVLVAAAELLHARRIRRVARLAFGPTARPAPWVRGVPVLRTIAATAVAFGLVTLLHIPPRVHAPGEDADAAPDHLLLVLDVSPSMRLVDAGPTGDQARRARARDVIESLFQRVAIGKFLISIVAVYNGAKPVVVDTRDNEVVKNILGDLPLEYAFKPGKTRLLDGIAEAVKMAKPWPRDSTLLVLVSDGDTVPATGMPELPPAIRGVLVVGVGDPHAGKFIDGRQSRQDASTLRQIATRLHGEFHDANRLHLPTDLIRGFSAGGARARAEPWTLREYALLAVAAGSAVLALLPLLLHFVGTAWRPGVRTIRTPDPLRAAAG